MRNYLEIPSHDIRHFHDNRNLINQIYIDESPHFLSTNSPDTFATIKVLDKISITNGAGNFVSDISVPPPDSTPQNYSAFVSSKQIFFKFVICAVIWFNITLGYFGMLFVFHSFIEDVYMEGMILFITESVSVIFSAYAVNFIGIKKSCSFLLCDIWNCFHCHLGD